MLFGIDDRFVDTVTLNGNIVAHIMSVTQNNTTGLLEYNMFSQDAVHHGVVDTVFDFGNVNVLDYVPLTETVKIIGSYPIFRNLDHRYFVSVETDLMITAAKKVVDGKETIDRSISKSFFPSTVRVLLESENGVLREDVDFEIETRIGQHSFVKKTEPSRQWSALQTSYDLRFYRFHLYVTYRYFKQPENRWIFSRLKYPIQKDESWTLGLEFVSKI